MTMLCEDKVAVVTGAAGKGMGRSVALTLAREGAKVVVNYLTSENEARAIVDYVTGSGSEAITAQADVFKAEGCKELVERTIERFGRIDICIVNPGAGWHPEPPDRLDAAAAIEDVHHEVAPLFHLMPLVLPGMYQRKWGRLIALSMGSYNSSPSYAYNVAKAARSHAMLLAREQTWKNRVTLNIIGPGPVPEIETLKEAIEQCQHGVAWQQRTTTSPQDIAEGVAFLCSESGRFITGCELPYLY